MGIRPFTPDDWAAVRDIHDLCKPDEMGGAVDPAAILPLNRDPLTLALFARSSVYVMDDGERVAGFAAHVGSYISWLCVHPSCRRRGIATALLSDLLGRLEPPVTLNVAKQNRPARTLYESFGFEVARDFVGLFNGHPVDVLRLRRNGPPAGTIRPARRYLSGP